jgi:hypothetical protein
MPMVVRQEPPAQTANSTALSEPSVYRVYFAAPTSWRAVWGMNASLRVGLHA